MAQFELEKVTYLGERKEEIDFHVAYVSIDNYLDWKVIIRGTTDQNKIFIEIMKKNEQPVFELITTEGETLQGRTKIVRFIHKLIDTEIDLFGIGKLNGYEIRSVQ
ncbi:hypothetical protein CON65_16370 [Bacillus pseudomycoides]|uniref:Uncharacterized protein n=1 Tax=Bacillus pseudomycoides TaxID=64104 RepID=A0AA91ZSE2_9BACI|nr:MULTISPECIES: hypothetical protein [Bacillus]PEB48628.1 hypothetical protein COO03_24145 [Bacillus sp. AFS098217]PED81581.1 hypothetical protein CON65_16370 [Bacillus pseudomycoides]PEU07504.1 hypothetical protein CN524_20570 [Bacillus sp. AFS019443]PEU08504.1 hypothetical protein CN525_25870 [Bacillus sp. AFS014408]PFW62240.1 hypothetical protein COL20_14240 [Bacillus sp. AFS075034]